MTNEAQHQRGRALIYVVALVTILAYWGGLKGPFLLDDLPNLSPLQQWLDGQAGAVELILGNSSGMLGRPLSMATLWLSAATGGMHPFPFKLGNLLVHLACGFAGWQLLKRLLAQDPRLAAHANLVAGLLAAVWLLHPINVSTVLYAVQRMAQLSTLFALLSVLTYVVARRQLVDGHGRAAAFKLMVLFPALVLAGLLSKENTAVAPLLCLAVELAYFLRQPRGGKVLPIFFSLFLLFPVLLAIGLLTTDPGRLLGYGGRDFTLWERLLSQPRALFEYLGLILWPRPGLMGVFVDTFPKSTGLLSPVTTLLSMLALLGISGFAIAVRRQAPSIFAGWFFFLAAHSVESTIFPLELYFEHRNYLPGFGLWLGVAGLLSWLSAKARMPVTNQAQAGLALAFVVCVTFASMTWQQARVWRSPESIARQTLEHRPTSLRAILSLATTHVQAGRADEARRLVQRLIDSQDPRHQLLGYVHATTIDCLRGHGGDLSLLQKAEETGVSFLTLAEAQAYTQLSRAIGAGRCGPTINDNTAADSIVRLLDSTPEQGQGAQPKWLLRTTAASMYVHIGRWKDAQHQAELAWLPERSDTAIGGLLIRILIHNGDKAAAQRTLDQVRARVPSYQIAPNEGLKALQAQIDAMPGP